MEIREIKKAIRKHISMIKKGVCHEEKQVLSAIIAGKIESLPEFAAAGTVLIYYSLPDEVQTEAFIKKWSARKRLVLPVVSGDDLILKEYDKDMLRPGYFDIPEPAGTKIVAPEEIEFAIIPGVAFDPVCNRLGRGKGFYDRLLPHIECKLAGTGYHFQIVDSVPAESFDRRMDMVITDTTEYFGE